jgi:hypothetical protein
LESISINIPQLEIVERETVEAVALGVDIHRTAVGAPEIKLLCFPLRKLRHLFVTVIIEPGDQVFFARADFIQKARRE